MTVIFMIYMIYIIISRYLLGIFNITGYFRTEVKMAETNTEVAENLDKN